MADLSFRDARDLAAEYGAKLPNYDWNNPVADCWIDRVMWLPVAETQGAEALAAAIEEANRYAGR